MNYYTFLNLFLNLFFLCLQIVNEELEELLSQQQQIEGSYKKAIAKKQQLKSKTKYSQSLAKADDEIESIGKKLGNNTLKFGRSIQQNPLAIDNIIKIDNDRYVFSFHFFILKFFIFFLFNFPVSFLNFISDSLFFLSHIDFLLLLRLLFTFF